MNTIHWAALYLKHVFQMATINKVRLILTSIGIFSAVFLFSAGTILSSSYYEEKMRMIYEVKEQTVTLSTEQQLQTLQSELPYGTQAEYMDVWTLAERQVILSTQLDAAQHLMISAYVHGISAMTDTMPVITEDGLFIPVNARLVKGRGIMGTDIQTQAKVVVIDELTEAMLFPDGDSLGQTISFGLGGGGYYNSSSQAELPSEFIVVGVVKNAYVAENTKLALKKEFVRSAESLIGTVSMYCPVSTIQALYAEADKNHSIFCRINDRSSYLDFTKTARKLSEIKQQRQMQLTVTTKEMLLESLQEELSGTKLLINLVSFLLCVISGISIMSVTLFAIKERIPEIGIRKAFGASRLDIAFQFLFEMVIISALASCFAVACSIAFCAWLTRFLAERLFISFPILISPQLLILPLFIGILEAVVCSIVPSLYATKIKVTEALKFE